ncbi:hypothetical protein NLJ89_g6998 [Agrocybe chaxingu]|uniref:Uncharacterized protein n=1 Tax=Agrocybe chaxingu TaxID=84603 RepID=A0A9W8MS55_9AGAR|nr:hypothetical protein NLJ89_g6998 [Agrocybe chaxingu]
MYQSLQVQHLGSDFLDESLDIPSPLPEHVEEGYIMKAKPKFFEPRPPRSSNVGQHPVIVLTRPDSRGCVKIATMSHSHPGNPPTRPASEFGLPIDPKKGESTVCVGPPAIVHVSYLRHQKPPIRMDPEEFVALRTEILGKGKTVQNFGTRDLNVH